jgi:hypothetical protein
MKPHRPVRRIVDLSRSVAFLGCLVGLLPAPIGSVAASEVMSALTEAARHPVAPNDVSDTMDVGTRGPGRPARSGHGGRCAGCEGRPCADGRCSHGACRHDGCGNPGCPAHCPVRPASFGYYGTQWRTWPGQGIELVTRVERAAPVMPPKSEVPTAADEAPVRGLDSAPSDTADAAPTEPRRRDPEPSTLPPPDADEPSKPDSPAQSGKDRNDKDRDERAQPDEARPGKEKSEGDNLFDESNLRRRTRERLAMLGQAAVQQERLRREALRQQAMRLVRPPAAEAQVKQATHLEADPR